MTIRIATIVPTRPAKSFLDDMHFPCAIARQHVSLLNLAPKGEKEGFGASGTRCVVSVSTTLAAVQAYLFILQKYLLSLA